MLSLKYWSELLKVEEKENTTVLTNITLTSFKNNTCFIGDWINCEENVIYHLTLRLDKLSSEACFFLGLSPSDEHTKMLSMEECCPNCYGYCGNGRIYFNDSELGTVEGCSQGDLLDLVYNVPNRTLSINMNQKEEVLLFSDILAVDYKFAISLSYAGDQCTILQITKECYILETTQCAESAEMESVSAHRRASNVMSSCGTERDGEAVEESLIQKGETPMSPMSHSQGMHQMNVVTKDDSSSDEAVETDQMVTKAQGVSTNIGAPTPCGGNSTDHGTPSRETKGSSCLSCIIL